MVLATITCPWASDQRQNCDGTVSIHIILKFGSEASKDHKETCTIRACVELCWDCLVKAHLGTCDLSAVKEAYV